MPRTVLLAVCVLLGGMLLADALAASRSHVVPPPPHAALPPAPVAAPPVRSAPPPPPVVVRASSSPLAPVSTLDLYARLATRRRLAREGDRVYIDSLLLHADSTVVRWDGHPVITVALVSDSTVPGWSPELLDEARAGIQAWDDNAAGIVFREVSQADSADVVVRWAARLADSTASGVTRLDWGADGVIRSAAVTLALHRGADSILLPGGVRRRVAAHEFGHVLGLAHSDSTDDLMFATSPVPLPSPRDQATLRLLYAVPPGPLRVLL